MKAALTIFDGTLFPIPSRLRCQLAQTLNLAKFLRSRFRLGISRHRLSRSVVAVCCTQLLQPRFTKYSNPCGQVIH
jgi:hypothetical protein